MPRVFIPRTVTEDNALGGSKIEKSLRFNGDDTYLSRTPSSASNRRTWTWSAWIKKSKNGAVQDLFSAYDGSAYNIIRIGSDDQLNFQSNSAAIKETSAVLRDISAWYHIVVAIDTTSSTAADRVIIYINGTRQSLATDNSVSQNTEYAFNTTNAHTIGVYANGSSYNFDGYMAEINFVDGYQYDASYFGFTDGQTGMWMPKRYEGTYGTNGFYLDLGNASSGDEYQRYTVPTASFTNDSDTLLLINNNESNGSTTFTDSSSNGYSISGTGSIAHSTAQSKFGSSSILFDGSDDSLSVGGNGTLYSEMTASSNKTYEAFMYLNADDYTYIMSISSNQRYLGFYMDAGNGKFGFNGNYPNPYSSVQGFVPALDIPIGRWFHVFIQRNADGTMSVGFDGKILVDSVAEGADVSASGTTGPLKIGSQHYYGSTHRYFYDGYMDEIRMSDTPRYTALGGTGTIGQDYSGNNNNFTPKNFSLGGVVKDTPTNNFCTFNPLNSGSITDSNGNLKATKSANHETIHGTLSMPSGKWYWELYNDNSSSGDGGNLAGLGSNAGGVLYSHVGSTATSWGYEENGNIWNNNNGSNAGSANATLADKDILAIAYDADQGIIRFYKNNTIQTNGFTGITADNYLPQVSLYDASSSWIANFGQDSSFTNSKLPQGYKDDFGRGDFYYPVPSGYKALCSANLPPNTTSIIRPQKHFETLTYTGTTTGSGTQSISDLEFSPDFVWIKSRAIGYSHLLVDTVRGASKGLLTEDTDVEETSNQYGMVTAFGSNGFTMTRGSSDGGKCCENTQTYVAWCWKAGGTAVSNSDGSITSSVSANTEAGFSIVSFTGNQTSGATVGHGLNSKPKWIIVKERGNANDWTVYHESLGYTGGGDTYVLFLNLTNDYGGGFAGGFNNTAPTTSVFSLGNSVETNRSGGSFIAYCWSEVPGFSKFGSYTGNGSSDGMYINLEFRPAWVMIKRTTGTQTWRIFDNKRNPFNDVDLNLQANSSNAEFESSAYNALDFLSNGFKLVGAGADEGTNQNGETYVYMAFAEEPGTTPFDTFPNAR